MLIKISIALVIIMTIPSGIVAAYHQQPGVKTEQVLINRCVPDYPDPLCNRDAGSRSK
jgi:hypothetical protein